MKSFWRVILCLLLSWPMGAMAAPQPVTINPGWRVGAYGRQAAPQYGVDWRSLGETEPPVGWGVYAVAQGQTLDLQYGAAGWERDPMARSGALAAGFGWRESDVTLMFGYARPIYSTPSRGWLDPVTGLERWLRNDQIDLRPQSVIGLSFTINLQ